MDKPVKISVIIPAYNAEKDLPQTLEKLFQSSHKSFEVFVVNDASNDRTAEIASEFPLKLVTLDENSGAAKARNIGARKAQGEVLFFIDADVWVNKDTLELLESSFSHNSNPVAVVGAYQPTQPIQSFYSHFQNFYTFYNHDKCQSEAEGLIAWFWTACGAVKRSVFQEMGGFREIYTGASAEDMDLGYRMAEKGYPLLLNKNIEVTHSHRHTFKSIVKNNFKKAAAWGELFLRKNRSGEYKHGFTSQRNFLTLFLVALITLSLGLSLITPWSVIFLFTFLCFVAVINYQFYTLIYSHRGLIFLIPAFIFHLVSTFAIGIGGVVAILRKVTGKEGEVSQ